MKENQILVVIKEPGREAYVEPMFDNTLEAFQKAVDGYIETVTMFTDVVLICNEEGRLRELPHNTTVLGVPFCGTVIAVGKKRDEFCSLKAQLVPEALRLLNGGSNENA